MGRDGQGVGQPLLVQRKQHVDRGLVALLDRRRRIAAHHALLAEILEDQESVIQISVMDDRCRESVLPQAVRHRHERHDTVGKMRDRAVGLAAAHRGAVSPARHVHQDHVLVAEGEPLVRARGGIALHPHAERVAIAALGDELARRRHAVDPWPEASHSR